MVLHTAVLARPHQQHYPHANCQRVPSPNVALTVNVKPIVDHNITTVPFQARAESITSMQTYADGGEGCTNRSIVFEGEVVDRGVQPDDASLSLREFRRVHENSLPRGGFTTPHKSLT